MGFWNKAGVVSFKAAKLLMNTATVVGNKIEKQAGEIKELKSEYELKSDEELLRIARSTGFWGSSPAEQGVARKILRERGMANSANL